MVVCVFCFFFFCPFDRGKKSFCLLADEEEEEEEEEENETNAMCTWEYTMTVQFRTPIHMYRMWRPAGGKWVEGETRFPWEGES